MPYASLADFLEELAAAGELARIDAEVDAAGEIAEITTRVAQADGPALWFASVRGQTTSVVANVLGTEARVCRALGVTTLDTLAEKVESLIQQHTPQSWFDRLKMSADDAGSQKFRAKPVKLGPVQQVVRLGRDIDLAGFPLVTPWPGQTLRAITAGLVITASVDSEEQGITVCPLVALDANRLAVVDDGDSSFARHWAAHQAAGAKLRVAVVLGGDPAMTVAARLALPESIDPLHVAGLLRGKAIDLVKCRTHELVVPGEADFVFEGYIDPQVDPVSLAVPSAGNQLGNPRPLPVLHLAAVTHRAHPVFVTMIPSSQAGEEKSLVKVRERMLLPALRAVAPEVCDLHLPTWGGMHAFAFVAIHKRHPFQARQVASALWGMAMFKFIKFMILVDHGVEVHDVRQVLAAVGAKVAAERDLFFHDGPAHGGDLANSLGALARHVGLDATTKLPGEQTDGGPRTLSVDPDVRRRVTARWAEYGIPFAPGGAAPP